MLRRSWTAKSRLEMVKLNLGQQLQALDRFYPNYEKTRLMLKATIESLNPVGPKEGGSV